MLSRVSISDQYRIPVRVALGFSIGSGILSAFMLDHGESARLTGIGLLIFWLWVATAIGRRPGEPSRVDLVLIQWGCLPLVIGFQIAVRIAWYWRGLEY